MIHFFIAVSYCSVLCVALFAAKFCATEAKKERKDNYTKTVSNIPQSIIIKIYEFLKWNFIVAVHWNKCSILFMRNLHKLLVNYAKMPKVENYVSCK